MIFSRVLPQAGEGHELGSIAFVEAPRFPVGDVGEPIRARRERRRVAHTVLASVYVRR